MSSCALVFGLAAQAADSGVSGEATSTLAELPSYTELFVETIVALVIIVGLLLIVARFLPRWTQRMAQAPEGPIEILASRALEPRRRLYLVRVADEYCLIGSSESGLSPLMTLPDIPKTTQATETQLGGREDEA